MAEDRATDADASQNTEPTADHPDRADGILTTLTPASWQIWLLSAAAIVLIGGSGWWLLSPKPKAPEASATALLATAPPPANPHPHDQDGTPLSK